MATSCGIDNTIAFSSDPSNSVSISATAVYGGIRVSWSYPAVNPQAVAYVTLHRGTSESNGQPYVVTQGNSLIDQISNAQAGTRYYYWIEITSVNGTTFPLIGPASAIAPSLATDTLSLLEGQISSSNLAAALRSDIESIPSLRSDLLDERTGRLNAVSDIEALISDLNIDVTQVHNTISTETTQRTDGQNLLASQLSTLSVANGQNAAAITQEQTARVTAIDAEATQRNLLAARVTNTEGGLIDNFAAIESESSARADADSAEAEARTTLAARVTNTETGLISAFAAVDEEASSRATAISSEATARTTLAGRVNIAEGLVSTAQTDINNLDTELANTQASLLTVAGDLSTAETQIVTLDTAITNEATTRANEAGALATTLNELSTTSINSFRQNSAPTPAQGRKIGSLWTDTDNGNVTTQWNGSAWVPLENQVALDAFSAVQTIQTSISNGEFASATDITTLEASVTVVDGKAVAAQGDANTALTQSAPTTIDARIQDKLVAQVGFCLINGAPSTDKDNENDCNAAGGTWLPLAALAEAVRGVEINTPSGTVKIQDRMITYDTASVNASDALTDAANAQSSADDAQDDVNTLDTNLRAEYTLKIEVDPSDPNNDNKKLVGGFGLALENDNTLQAGFNVDRFWVGKLGDTYASANVPFIVDSNTGKVHIKDAVIQDAAITTAKIDDAAITSSKIGFAEIDTAHIADGAIENAKIGNEIRSTSFVSGSTGWRILKSGSAEFNSIKTTRANRVAFGTWTNPSTTWQFFKTGSGNNDDDWNVQSVSINDVDTGYNGDSVVQNLINKPLIVRAVISGTAFNSTNSSATGTIYTVQCTASIRIRYNAVVSGSVGPVPDGRISIDFFIPLPQNRFNSVYRIRVTTIKWALIQVN